MPSKYDVRHEGVSFLIPKVLDKGRQVKTPPEGGGDTDGEKISDREIANKLMELLALSEQYLIVPQDEETIDFEMVKANFVGEVQGDRGVDILDSFSQFVHRQELEQRGKLEKKEHDETASGDNKKTKKQVLKEKIKKQILEIMKDDTVRAKYYELLNQEKGFLEQPSVREGIQKINEIEKLLRMAKKMILDVKIDQATSTVVNKRKKKPVGNSNIIVGRSLKVVEAAQSKIDFLKAELSEQGKGIFAAQKFIEYKRQMESFGIALTPSTEKMIEEITELSTQGYKIFLGGPTGAGKTAVGVFALKHLTGYDYEVISWSGETTIRDIFGKPVIKTDERGHLSTSMAEGPYTRAISGKTKGILHDELTTGETGVQISLKNIWQSKEGEKINLPGFNGHLFDKERIFEIATGNLKGSRHQDREEMDPAVAREFRALQVPFVPADALVLR